MHVTDDESTPPLSRTAAGAVALSRERTASLKRCRKCSTYCWGVEYRMVFSSRKSL